MDAPEEVLDSKPAGVSRLGAAEPSADLGPISPELALVDETLAERARMLLPDTIEGAPRRVAPEPSSSPVYDRPDLSLAPAGPRRTRRWRRTLVLAGLVFAVGAASGGLLGRQQPAQPSVPLEARGKVPTVTGPTEPRTQTLSKRRSSRDHSKPSRAAQAAPNVLGVTTAVGRRGVRLGWQRPVDSDHVAVIRARGARRSKVVVFRGRGTSYRDASTHPCTTYRYTIVNYDVRGRRSTGVPTSVLTDGCT